MKEITLTRGHVAIVDDDDFERLSKFKWWAQVSPRRRDSGILVYAKRKAKISGKWTAEPMHRFILGLTGTKLVIDHINHNGLDNRKENLRVCNTSENIANSRIRCDNASGYKGVSWYTKGNKWRAAIGMGGSGFKKHLGYFTSKEEAAEAYRAAALTRFGEFAFVPMQSEG